MSYILFIFLLKCMAYGSLVGGPFVLRWIDHPTFTVFNFSVFGVDSAGTWAAIGLSSDQTMVKLIKYAFFFL